MSDRIPNVTKSPCTSRSSYSKLCHWNLREWSSEAERSHHLSGSYV